MSNLPSDIRNKSAEALIELANYRMPFGRYKGFLLVDLPEPYVVWFHQKGFPEGKLGRLLAEMYEVKVNGLEHLLRKLIHGESGS